MGNAEATLRERIQGTLTPGRLTEALDALLAELRATVSATRDVVLEEVAQSTPEMVGTEATVTDGEEVTFLHEYVAQQIRALQSAPVAVVRKAEVREVLLAIRTGARDGRGLGISEIRASGRLDVVAQVARALGVDLDARNNAPQPDTRAAAAQAAVALLRQAHATLSAIPATATRANSILALEFLEVATKHAEQLQRDLSATGDTTP